MYWDITKVRHVAPRTLYVLFSDGLEGTVVIDPSFCHGVFEALLDDDAIGLAKIDDGALTWPDGLDLAPDTMHKEIKASPERRYILRAGRS